MSSSKRFKEEEIKVGSVVQMISSASELALAFRGIGYAYVGTMSNVLGKTVTIVDRPRNRIFGLPSSVYSYPQPIWWYPFTAIKSIISTEPLSPPELPTNHCLQQEEYSVLTVNAYVNTELRGIKERALMHSVPRGVIDICWTYYHIPERFAVIPKSVVASHNDLCIKYTGNERWRNTSFGEHDIDMRSELCYRWKFQMINALESSFIGITTLPRINSSVCFIGIPNSYHYAYRTLTGEVFCNGSYQEYGNPLLTADTLTVELDTKNTQIRFQRNKEDPGKWIHVCETDASKVYRVAVSICTTDEIALLSFERKL